MRVAIESRNSTAIVAVRGSIDLFSIAVLKRELGALFASGAKHYIFDLEEVDFIDSSGLGMLVGTLKQARVGHGGVVLVAPRPAVRKIFALTRLNGVFEIVESVDEALLAAA